VLKFISAKTGTPLDRVEASAVTDYEKFDVLRQGRKDDVTATTNEPMKYSVPAA
jgi:hypothetical protein